MLLRHGGDPQLGSLLRGRSSDSKRKTPSAVAHFQCVEANNGGIRQSLFTSCGKRNRPPPDGLKSWHPMHAFSTTANCALNASMSPDLAMSAMLAAAALSASTATLNSANSVQISGLAPGARHFAFRRPGPEHLDERS